MNIEDLKPGLYFLGINDFDKKQFSSIKFDLIYIISVEEIIREKKAFQESWKGTVFTYYSFLEGRIFELNSSYWTDYIQSLEPIDNEKVLNAAKNSIQSIYEEGKRDFDLNFKELNLLSKNKLF